MIAAVIPTRRFLCVACGSLDNNNLCGVYIDFWGNWQGKYTSEAIDKLCEAFAEMPNLTSVS